MQDISSDFKMEDIHTYEDDNKFWNAFFQEKRHQRLQDNTAAMVMCVHKHNLWIKRLTDYHFSIFIQKHGGQRIDYWPTNKRFHIVDSKNRRGVVEPHLIHTLFDSPATEGPSEDFPKYHERYETSSIELTYGRSRFSKGMELIGNLILEHGHTTDKGLLREALDAEFALLSTFHVMEVCGIIALHRGEAMTEYTMGRHKETSFATGARIVKCAVAFNERYPYDTDWDDLFTEDPKDCPYPELGEATDWEDLICCFTDYWLKEQEFAHQPEAIETGRFYSLFGISDVGTKQARTELWHGHSEDGAIQAATELANGPSGNGIHIYALISVGTNKFFPGPPRVEWEKPRGAFV